MPVFRSPVHTTDMGGATMIRLFLLTLLFFPCSVLAGNVVTFFPVAVSTPPVSSLFDIDHEAGDFSEYDSTDTGSGALSVTGGAALNSTSYGMSVALPGTSNPVIYGQVNFASSSYDDLRLRFYVDPNSIALDDYQVVIFLNITGTCSFRFRKVGAQYSLRVSPTVDTGNLTYELANITDTSHYIEIYFQRATTNVSSDGAVRWWIDGVEKTGWTGVDNYDKMAALTSVQFGAPTSSAHSSVVGTYYIDEIVINSTGDTIGP